MGSTYTIAKHPITIPFTYALDNKQKHTHNPNYLTYQYLNTPQPALSSPLHLSHLFDRFYTTHPFLSSKVLPIAHNQQPKATLNIILEYYHTC